MSIQSDLKKDGIKVIKQLDTLKVNTIARNVSIKIASTFPNLGLSQETLFIKLSRLDMYMADMPEGMSEASYFYKNSSIYFNSHIDENDLEDYAIHECIHHIQERKDNKNYLVKMGLCDYSEFKIYGLALNEAAVQLMTSKILGVKKEFVKYYNIAFETTSPSYYPVECCLVNQLAKIAGEDLLFDSTINTNDNFKIKLSKVMGYSNFIKIENMIDSILNAEEKIISINNKIMQIDDRNKKVDNMIDKINSLKESIAAKFIETQNLIVTSYFDNQFEGISNLEEVENYRRELYTFKDYTGFVDGYSDFNDYYVDKMEQLEKKYYELENGSIAPMYLESRKVSKLARIVRFFRKLFWRNSADTEESKYSK